MGFASNSAAKQQNEPAWGHSGPVLRWERGWRPPVMPCNYRLASVRRSTGLRVEIPGLLLVLADDLHQFFAQRRVLLGLGQGTELRSIFSVVCRPLARRLHLPPAVPDIGFP